MNNQEIGHEVMSMETKSTHSSGTSKIPVQGPSEQPSRWDGMISAAGHCEKRLSDRLKNKIGRLSHRTGMQDSRRWPAW
jgi:hypothetical protein